MAPQPEWFEKDFYKVLGVAESATQKDVTRAYRKLARELHPDANPGDQAAEDRFKEVSAAYDVIGDEAKRKEYDEVRKLGPVGANLGGGFPGGAGGHAGRLQLRGRPRRSVRQPLPAARRRGPSGTQPGSGSAAGHRPRDRAHDGLPRRGRRDHHDAAPHQRRGVLDLRGQRIQARQRARHLLELLGPGVIDDNQGLFSFSRPGNVCAGKGVIVIDPCVTCNGTGVQRRPRDVKVRIPAGVRDGQTIKLKGRGGPGRNSGPPGDLFVQVHVAPDKLFGRDGSNLTLTVPVTFPEAALGTRLTIPTVEGDTVTLRLPAGTSSGKVFRVRGRGIDNGKRGRGDLLVTVEVAVPSKLNKEQKAAVESFAAASKDSPRNHLGV